jgi:glycerol-3-phosphate dehydrogenase
MPIVEQINKVLFENQSVSDAIHELLVRDKCNEYPQPQWEE